MVEMLIEWIVVTFKVLAVAGLLFELLLLFSLIRLSGQISREEELREQETEKKQNETI